MAPITIQLQSRSGKVLASIDVDSQVSSNRSSPTRWVVGCAFALWVRNKKPWQA